jgi:hypothetical protein
MGDHRKLDDRLRRYLDEDEAPTPVMSGSRMYVLGKLIAVAERAESLLNDVGPEGIDDTFVRLKLLRGITKLRELLDDVERALNRRSQF